MAKMLVNNIQIAFDDTGSGSPVILLHGFPFNRTLWNEQVTALSDAHRVITPDLRGFGASDVTDSPANMADMAQDVAALMDSLGIERAVIGGLSMGGYVVLAFYKLFPKRVTALVLADTRPQADSEEAKAIRAKQAKEAISEGMAGIANSMLPKLFAPASVTNKPQAVQRVREMMMTTKPAGAAAALMGMAAREDHTETLVQISVPTLILVGREDPITPLSDSENMHQQIAGSELVVIDNASHVSNVEQADEFNSHLESFLNKLN
ncbi:MAG: alpha/beta hydrolase [Acidobacteria bacterium]|nr:MAG: alpha/beta hydrolase [Acidobacteriota bacterium]